MNTTPSFRAESGSAVGLCIRIVLLFMSGELQGGRPPPPARLAPRHARRTRGPPVGMVLSELVKMLYSVHSGHLPLSFSLTRSYHHPIGCSASSSVSTTPEAQPRTA